MSSRVWRRYPVVNAMAVALLCGGFFGCRSARPDAGTTLPVVPAGSSALPGSVNSADAPEAPRVQINANAMTTLHDPELHFTLRYPGSWRPIVSGGVMNPPAFTETLGPAKGTEAFLAAGTPLARTNLLGISFSWGVKTRSDEGACRRLATGALPMGTALPSESIGGITFNRGTGGDNGMCRHTAATVDTVLRGRDCLVFERNLETSCPDINAPAAGAELTKAQRTELERELDRVMASVVLQ